MRYNHKCLRPANFLTAVRPRAGLTLVEVIVVIVVSVILAAAIVPSLIGALDRERVQASVDAMQGVTDAMSELRQDNQDWPGRISHLSAPITTSMTNVCGNTYTTGRVTNWAGPYLDRVVPSTGVPIGIGVLKDTTYRSFVTGNDGLLTMEILNVTLEDARGLNTTVDGDGDVAGQTIGTVRWSAPVNGMVTTYYYRPIRGC
ncbi:MAG: prepilin-type N-terminal cleavage/methylation domain-containing protein [Gemmatimonadota bacterium]